MRKRDEIAHSYRLFVLVLWRFRSNRLVGKAYRLTVHEFSDKINDATVQSANVITYDREVE